MVTKLTPMLLRRKSALIPSKGEPATAQQFATAVSNLVALGYVPDSKFFEARNDFTLEDLTELLKAAETILGVADYKPMYPNFPTQVMEASDVELYVNAILHYVLRGLPDRGLPEYAVLARHSLPADERMTRKLTVADESLVQELMNELAGSGQPWSSDDLEDVKLLAEFVQAPAVAVRENAAALAAVSAGFDFEAQANTVTDYLRLSAALSGGDASLTTPTRFRLSNAQRRRVIRGLERLSDRAPLEDFKRHEEAWKRLFKVLHVSPKSSAFALVNAVARGEAPAPYASLEAALSNLDLDATLAALRSRPGDFARRLHEVLRKFPSDESVIVTEFEKVAPKVSLRVLVQMHNYFTGPLSSKVAKLPFASKSRSLDGGFIVNKLDKRYPAVVRAIEAGMAGRHSDKTFNWDAQLAKSLTMPLGVRSALPGQRLVGTGSRVKLDADVVRMFMHWRGAHVDLDLSASLLDETCTKVLPIAYYNLRDRAVEAAHSGDIVSAPEGAAEFIDVSVDSALKAGFRYVLMTVHSYSRQPFSSIEDAWAGVMARKAVKSGEIFEPSTVAARFDLVSDSRSAAPVAFDLKTREMIWLGSAVTSARDIAFSSDAAAAVKHAMEAKPMTMAKFLRLTGVTRAVSADTLEVEDASTMLPLLAG